MTNVMETPKPAGTGASQAAAFNGAAWAAIVAGAIGCVAYGVFINMAEASKAASNAMNLYNPAGDLSGKTTYAIGVWVVAWVVLHLMWKGKRIRRPGGLAAVVVVLVLLALLASFPPFFEIFAGG